jgi:hypothetical protein
MIIYDEDIEELLRSKNYIYFPRKLKKHDHLKLYKKYYSTFSNTYFKVHQIYYTENTEYYSIKYLDTRLFAEISYPYELDYLYELLTDRKDIIHIPNIINTDISYTGAEIKLWFFYQQEQHKFSKYYKFKPLIDKNSDSVICDEKYYFVYADKSLEGNYYNCRILLDTCIK